MKTLINIIGKTEDDKPVVSGLFKMFDTFGTPLYILFDLCNEQGWMPSWIHFYDEAHIHGWKHETIMNRLRDGMSDVYDNKFVDVVMRKLNERNE